MASLVAASLREMRVVGCGGGRGSRQLVSSAMEGSMAVTAAATAVLPLRAAAVVMKTPAVTAMAGAQTTTNNQLNVESGRRG